MGRGRGSSRTHHHEGRSRITCCTPYGSLHGGMCIPLSASPPWRSPWGASSGGRSPRLALRLALPRGGLEGMVRACEAEARALEEVVRGGVAVGTCHGRTRFCQTWPSGGEYGLTIAILGNPIRCPIQQSQSPPRALGLPYLVILGTLSPVARYSNPVAPKGAGVAIFGSFGDRDKCK